MVDMEKEDEQEENLLRAIKEKSPVVLPSALLSLLKDDTQSLWCPHRIEVLDEPPSSLVFLREFVAKSRPCILRPGALPRDNTLPRGITLDDLCALGDECTGRGDLLLTVDVTPSGRGDAIHAVFSESSDTDQATHVRPLPVRMTLHEFRQRLRRYKPQVSEDGRKRYCSVTHSVYEPTAPCTLGQGLLSNNNKGNIDDMDDSTMEAVYYYSQQNDNLRQELSLLWEQLALPESPLEWAAEAFGMSSPDAINLWIGNESATSSCHKDHYENMYYVASGEKIFYLYPPSNALFLEEEEYPSGQFVRVPPGGRKNQEESLQWGVQLDSGTAPVRWIGSDVEGNEYATVLEVRVREGEMLYLPSLWFHRVTQTSETVAINWWYDMHFDSPQWTYFHFLQALSQCSSRGGK